MRSLTRSMNRDSESNGDTETSSRGSWDATDRRVRILERAMRSAASAVGHAPARRVTRGDDDGNPSAAWTTRAAWGRSAVVNFELSPRDSEHVLPLANP